MKIRLALAFLRNLFRILNILAPKTAANLAEKLFLWTKKPNLSVRDKLFLLTARESQIPFRDTYMIGYEWGNPEDPPVLLVHGWSSSAATFIKLVPKLLANGYRVVSYDMVSHGRSPYKIAQITCWADALRTVTDFYGSFESIIGHSLGGAGILIASKLGLPTKKLILLSPCSDLLDISDRFAKILDIPDQVLQMKQDNIWSKYQEHTTKYGNDWSEIFVTNFKVPTLIIHDIDDHEIELKNSVKVRQIWPWAKIRYTEELGHQDILRDSLTISNIVNYINDSNNWCFMQPSNEAVTEDIVAPQATWQLSY